MRWPLRYQLTLPAAGMMLFVLALVSASTAYLSARRVRTQMEDDLANLAVTLSEARYPLSDSVLAQIRRLSGVDLVVTEVDGHRLSSSDGPDVGALRPAEQEQAPTAPAELRLGDPQQIGEQRYFYTAIELPPREPGTHPRRLHLLYPERRWREARREALWLPLAVGLISLPVVAVLSLLLASRWSRPIIRLRDHVRRIASGKYEHRVEVDRNDEIRDLADSLNALAAQLERFDVETRHSERLRILHQLGSGIAHQIRNAVTGAVMAADIHEQSGDPEALAVVRRQLRLLEANAQRFLALGQPAEHFRRPLPLCELIDQACSLVGPAVTHANVEMRFDCPPEDFTILANHDALHDAITNLLINAYEAAAAASGPDRAVWVGLEPDEAGQNVSVKIRDSGAGPDAQVVDTLFEPFVTAKPEGTGLGLFVAQRVVQEHGGRIDWRREDGYTCFTVTLPIFDGANVRDGASPDS